MGTTLDNNQTLVPLEDKIYSVVAVEIPKIKDIWNVLGMSAEDVASREKMIVFHLKKIHMLQKINRRNVVIVPYGGASRKYYMAGLEMLKQMYLEESKHKDNILKKIEKNARLYTILCKELGKDPLDPSENLKTLEVERFFRRKLEETQAEKEERMKIIRDMKSQEEILCRQLGQTPVLFSLEILPGAGAVADLKKRVDDLRVELGVRYDRFKELRGKIMSFLEVLDVKPTTEFEREIVSSDTDVLLSADRMTKIKEVYELYRSRDERARTEATEIRNEISKLLNRLELPEQLSDDTKEFLRSGNGYTSGDLKALRTKLSELLQIKRQEISKYIERCRVQLKQLWEDLYFSDYQKDSFQPNTEDDEELLKAYEDEIDRLTTISVETQHVYQKFQDHQQLWHKMQDLEIRSNDTNRYNNRGGALLLEEKERKKITRDIPKVEDDLNVLVDEYDADHPENPVLVYGKRMKDYVRSQWDMYEEQKDKEKQMRAIMRTKQIEKEATLGARPMTPKATPNRKRPVGPASTISPSKRAKLIGSLASSSAASSLKRANSTRALHVDRTVVAEIRPVPQMADMSFVSTDTTYSDFKENLESKGKKDTNTRSSISNRRMSRSTPNLARAVLHTRTSPRGSPRRGLISTPQSASMLLRTRSALAGKSPGVTRSTPKLTPSARRFHLL